jgi:hypothetical protein
MSVGHLTEAHYIHGQNSNNLTTPAASWSTCTTHCRWLLAALALPLQPPMRAVTTTVSPTQTCICLGLGLRRCCTRFTSSWPSTYAWNVLPPTTPCSTGSPISVGVACRSCATAPRDLCTHVQMGEFLLSDSNWARGRWDILLRPTTF